LYRSARLLVATATRGSMNSQKDLEMIEWAMEFLSLTNDDAINCVTELCEIISEGAGIDEIPEYFMANEIPLNFCQSLIQSRDQDVHNVQIMDPMEVANSVEMDFNFDNPDQDHIEFILKKELNQSAVRVGFFCFCISGFDISIQMRSLPFFSEIIDSWKCKLEASVGNTDALFEEIRQVLLNCTTELQNFNTLLLLPRYSGICFQKIILDWIKQFHIVSSTCVKLLNDILV
jgi:hypothetical protein